MKTARGETTYYLMKAFCAVGLKVAGYIDQRGEPIVNPVTGAEHRIRIEPVGGFEFKQAEIGRGWTKATGPIAYDLTDSYGQFCELHLCQDGIIN